MQHRNYILFIVLSLVTLVAWDRFVVPLVAPKKPPAKIAAKEDTKSKLDAKASAKKDAAGAERGSKAEKEGAAKQSVAANAASKQAATKAGPNSPAVAAAATGAKNQGPAPPAPASFPHKTIVLGSLDPESGYFLQAELNSKGASVNTIELNDLRYRELTASKPLAVVGNDLRTTLRTFNTEVPAIDALLAGGRVEVGGGSSVAEKDWSVAEVTSDPAVKGVNSAVTFRYPSPDGQLVVEKRYWLERIPEGAGSSRQARDVRDTHTDGYLLHLDIALKNVGKEPLKAAYVLQGPVGLPLENAENTRKFRDLKMGFLSPGGALNAQTLYAKKAVDNADANPPVDQEWKAPIQYIGVDVQYFAALVVPGDNQLTDETIARSKPLVVDRPKDVNHTDLSVVLESKKVELAPQQAVTEHFELFAGPKRKELLLAIRAEGILDWSYFSPPIVSHAMLALLNFLHRQGLPYGIAIICLTILVRACMFPISLRQAAQAQRMKEMQPKVAELKKKYGNDKEKLARAQMELMREHKINPLAGCLPIFIQLPIFTGLWMALNSSVDLRRAPFLYFSNLAAPDALFHLPFVVPFLGWTDFNLLPFITVALFVVQQKMFMPPPTDEQQEMQYKMMNMMTLVMGVMFYRVPAGLCVYFISSSLWGIGERKLLELWKKNQPAPETLPEPAEDEKTRTKSAVQAANKAASRAGDAAGSFWKRLVNAADQAGAEATSGSKSSISRRGNHNSGKKNGRRPR